MNYDKFREVVNGIEVYYAFVEAPVALLDTPIPQEELDSVYGITVDEEGNYTSNKTGVVLRDFVLRSWPSPDGQTELITLGARQFDVGRVPPVNANDLARWDANLTPYGYGPDKWLTRVEAMDRLQTWRGDQ